MNNQTSQFSMIEVYVSSAELFSNFTPFVNIEGVSGKSKYFFYQTEKCQKTKQPVWDPDYTKPYLIPFFCFEELVFDVYSYNKVIPNKQIGTARLKITLDNNGKQLKLPIELKKNVDGEPVINVMYKLPTNQFPVTEIRDANMIYSYMSFNPPIGSLPGSPLVRPIYYAFSNTKMYYTYEPVNAIDSCENYVTAYPNSVYRDFNDWVDVRKFDIKKMNQNNIVAIQVDGHGYQGTVTMNFVGVKEKETKGKTIIENVYGMIDSHSLNIDLTQNQTVTLFPFYLTVDDNHIPVFNTITLQASCDIREVLISIGNSFYNGLRFWSRYYISRGTTITLAKAAEYNGIKLGYGIFFGLGWDTHTDLDASVYCYKKTDNGYKNVDICYFGDKSIFNGAIRHSGDNLTGAGTGDDERIYIALDKIPQDVTLMIVGVTSYLKVNLNEVKGGFMRVVDTDSNLEVMYLKLAYQEPKTCLLFAVLNRVDGNEWDIYPVIRYYKANAPGPANKKFLKTLNDPNKLEDLLTYNYES